MQTSSRRRKMKLINQPTDRPTKDERGWSKPRVCTMQWYGHVKKLLSFTFGSGTIFLNSFNAHYIMSGRKTPKKNNSHAPRAGVGHSAANKSSFIGKLRLTDSFTRFPCRNSCSAYVLTLTLALVTILRWRIMWSKLLWMVGGLSRYMKETAFGNQTQGCQVQKI